MPLQELPLLCAQGSMLHLTKRGNKRKPREDLEVECTPTGYIQQCTPRHRHQRLLSQDKENDDNHFVIARRPRRKRETVLGKDRLLYMQCFVSVSNDIYFNFLAGLSWDHLPDELLLKILFCLPLRELLKMSLVCKRWHRLVYVPTTIS